MNKAIIFIALLATLISPLLAQTSTIPEGNITVNIVPYNVSFDYTLNEDKNLTILEINNSKECDLAAYFGNSAPNIFGLNITNDSTIKTYKFDILNGTIAVIGVNSTKYNKIDSPLNCTFVGENKSIGYSFFLIDNIGPVKSCVIKLKYEQPTDNSDDNGDEQPTYNSGHNGRSGSTHAWGSTITEYKGVAKDIKSEKIKQFVYKAKLIVGSNVDLDLSAKNLKDDSELIKLPTEIKEDCILVGGLVANPLVKKYQFAFKVKVTNNNPGKNKGVIQKQLINGHTVVLLAGSDRYGTKAAVEYFKTLDDIPDEPIFVKWENGKVVKIEKP